MEIESFKQFLREAIDETGKIISSLFKNARKNNVSDLLKKADLSMDELMSWVLEYIEKTNEWRQLKSNEKLDDIPLYKAIMDLGYDDVIDVLEKAWITNSFEAAIKKGDVNWFINEMNVDNFAEILGRISSYSLKEIKGTYSKRINNLFINYLRGLVKAAKNPQQLKTAEDFLKRWDDLEQALGVTTMKPGTGYWFDANQPSPEAIKLIFGLKYLVNGQSPANGGIPLFFNFGSKFNNLDDLYYILVNPNYHKELSVKYVNLGQYKAFQATMSEDAFNSIDDEIQDVLNTFATNPPFIVIK